MLRPKMYEQCYLITSHLKNKPLYSVKSCKTQNGWCILHYPGNLLSDVYVLIIHSTL